MKKGPLHPKKGFFISISGLFHIKRSIGAYIEYWSLIYGNWCRLWGAFFCRKFEKYPKSCKEVDACTLFFFTARTRPPNPPAVLIYFIFISFKCMHKTKFSQQRFSINLHRKESSDNNYIYWFCIYNIHMYICVHMFIYQYMIWVLNYSAIYKLLNSLFVWTYF